MHISVIIPTYKNTEVLIKNLKHNLPYLEGCEVIVVNDNPQSSIAQELDQFVQVKLIENTENKGFSGTVNTGVAQATHSFIMLLNDDVKLLNTAYQKALNHFINDTSLFAVTFAQKEKSGAIVGKNAVYWSKGFVRHKAIKPDDMGKTAWAEGGSCIIDKEKFIKLHGFDELYSPFYWEDIDLSYRAWKNGYSVLFDPQILVEHHHETTISSHFDTNRIETIAYRNQLLFIWKNISSWELLLIHKLHLMKMIIRAIIKNDVTFLEGFLQAMKYLPTVISKHFQIPQKRKDYEILRSFIQ